MLRLVTGAFHPDLEQALLDHLDTIKQAAPLALSAIVVPSTALRRRLQWLLCVEQGRGLLNLHILTFHQLTRRLLGRDGLPDEPELSSSTLFRELVHLSLRKLVATGPGSPWSNLAEMPGAWTALWATCKDLKDAAVDPDVVLEALEAREPPPPPATAGLIRLYADVRAAASSSAARDPDDLAVEALHHLDRSPFLQSLADISYYGFYDLTQVQLDLFREMTRRYPTTLFFLLLRRHPAFGFAERFFERYLHGLLHDPADWRQVPVQPDRLSRQSPLQRIFAVTDQEPDDDGRSGGPARTSATVQMVDAAGREDEVTFVAKDILRLVEGSGYAFHEIGVVGRTLAGYESMIPRVFREQHIPFATTLSRPLAAYPLVQVALLLLDVKQQRYRRDLVIELLSASCFDLHTLCPEGTEPEPDLWDLASRRAGIARGLDEWRRLEAYCAHGLPLSRRVSDTDDDDGKPASIPGSQLRLLLGCLAKLDEALAGLPEQATWAEYLTHLQTLWSSLLAPQTRHLSDAEKEDVTPEPDLREVFAALTDLSRLPDQVPFDEMVAALHRIVQETRVPVAGQSDRGVQVLDAMTARGLPFRALYIVNVNERVFPRHIREDAFLRDAERRFLEADLGYKVTEKLAGFEEEKLLFWLLANAATERLTLLTLRSDDTGRPVIPSLYLDEIRQAAQECQSAALSIPRRWTQRQAHPRLPHFQSEWLNPREMVVGAGLTRRRVALPLLRRLPGGDLLPKGLEIVRCLDSGRPALGDYDGVIGHVPSVWQRLIQRVAPTGLRSYGICPFQYFARQVLRLRSIEEPEEIGEVGPVEVGTLAHAILRDVHRAWHAEGITSDGWRAVDVTAGLARAAAPHFHDYARTHPVGYPFLWDVTQARLLDLLSRVVQEDLQDLRNGGWRPILFESPVQADVPVALPTGSETLHCEGQIDRVDWSAAGKTYRILDYKYKTSRTAKTLEKNLILAAVRGREWQPPFYLLMAEQMVQEAPPADRPAGSVTSEGVWFQYLAPKWREDVDGAVVTPVVFPGDAWTGSLGARLRATLALVMAHIRSGRFFIAPGSDCEQCDYRAMCRLHHQPSRWRARADHAQVETYRRLRHAEVEKAGGTPAADLTATGDAPSERPPARKRRKPSTDSPR